MEVKVVGNPCGFHGPYTFYKGLCLQSTSSANSPNKNVNVKIKQNLRKCVSDNLKRENKFDNCNLKPLILALGDCVPVRLWPDSPIACLAEVRMIWRDKIEQCLLVGLRLYFLPENTPNGRNCHGEDEVLAMSDKVVIRADDLTNWLVVDLEWNWGLPAPFNDKSDRSFPPKTYRTLAKDSKHDFSEVDKDKQSDENACTRVAVLSYSRYCRYRATLKRLEDVEDIEIKTAILETLSGFIPTCANTRIMFCKDIFEYPDLETHELLCNHLAPKLKGRPRGRRKKSESTNFNMQEDSVESESNDSDASVCSYTPKTQYRKVLRPQLRYNHRPARVKTKSESSDHGQAKVDTSRLIQKHDKKEYVDIRRDKYKLKPEYMMPKTNTNIATEDVKPTPLKANIYYNVFEKQEERDFLRRLHEFMSQRANAFPKLIWMGLRDVNLYVIYNVVQKYGGFDAISDNKLWKSIFEENNLGAIMMTRKKYERILLPFERYERSCGQLTPTMGNNNNNIYSNNLPSEITISAVPNPSALSLFAMGMNHNFANLHSMNGHRSSPAVEIIPIKRENGIKMEPDLTREQMTEIQNLVKYKEHMSHSNSEDELSMAMPVTVILRPGSDDHDSNSSSNQPHTTITVHQKTNYPHNQQNSHYQQMQHHQQQQKNSPIQITNQIQIQQITVQSNSKGGAGDMRCNIKQDRNGQEIQIQSGDDSSLNPYNRKLMGDELYYDNFAMSQGKYNGSSNSKSSSVRNARGKQQQPMEKENIPLLFGNQATTITPVSSGIGASSNRDQRNDATEIIDLIDSDNETNDANNSNSKLSITKISRAAPASTHMPPMKKRKLDILREGGLEVTPISNGVPNPYLMHAVTSKNFRKDSIHSSSSGNHNAKPIKSKTDDISSAIPDVGAAIPPKFQSRCMYTKTSKIFGNPKDYLTSPMTTSLASSSSCSSASSSPSVIKAAPVSVITNSKPKKIQENLLDLTINPNHNSKVLIQDLSLAKLKKMSEQTGSNLSSSSRGSPQRNNHNKIRNTNHDLQITLVKPQMTHVQHIHNSQNHNIKKKAELAAEEKKTKMMASNAAASMQTQQQLLQSLANGGGQQNGGQLNNKTADLMSQFYPNFGMMNKLNTAAGLTGLLNNQMNPTQQQNQFYPMLDPIYLSALYNQGLMFPPPEILQQMFKNVPHGIPISKS